MAPNKYPYNTFLLFESQNGRQELNYIVKSYFCALQARSACEQTYISSKSFFRLTLQLFLTVQVSKQPLGANLCSKKHIFAHCGRARTKNGSYPDRFWAKTVPTSYRTPALVHPVPITPAQNIYYYIDVFNSAFTVYFKLIIAHQTFKVSALNSI